jgi:hypothetical protein
MTSGVRLDVLCLVGPLCLTFDGLPNSNPNPYHSLKPNPNPDPNPNPYDSLKPNPIPNPNPILYHKL